MKEINKKLISMSFTMILTCILLATALFAWFVSNKEVSSNGIDGQIYSKSVKDLKINCYYLEEDSTNTDTTSIVYTKGGLLVSGDKMKKYNDIVDNEVTDGKTAILLEIVCEVNETKTYNFTLNTTSSLITNSTILTDYTSNYLSNVLSIYKDISISDTKITAVVSSEVNFVDKTTHVKSLNEIDLGSIEINTGTASTIYLVVDYDDNLINYIYNIMLENCPEEATLNTEITFNEDLVVRVS